MVKFTLFGVPVTIHPWFWITSALLGGAYHAKTSEDLLSVALFVLVATFSILVHEFGHALVGRKLGGGYPNIQLVALMGLAYNGGARLNKWQRVWMIAAGPGAGFALGFIVMAVLGFSFGDRDALALTAESVLGHRMPLSMSTAQFLYNRPFLDDLISNLLWVNFWWGVINLVPVIPLDGGQIMNEFVRPQKRAHLIAVIAAGCCVAYALMNQRLYMAAMFGYLGYNNYKAMQENRWQ
jgi:Zn-dependent protease